MDANSIGKMIYTLRKQNGFTQKELASRINVTNKAVSKWENGINFPDPAIMDDLAEALGVSTTELVEGKIKEIRCNKPLLWLSLALPAITVLLIVLADVVMAPDWIRYVIFGSQVLSFVFVFASLILNREFIWESRDGYLVDRGLYVLIMVNWISALQTDYVKGFGSAMMAAFLILGTMLSIGETLYTKNSRGIALRVIVLAIFAIGLTLVSFYWFQPVLWGAE